MLVEVPAFHFSNSSGFSDAKASRGTAIVRIRL
jgi:hypothetical protein